MSAATWAKWLLVLGGLLLVAAWSQAADIERHWKSGCSPDNWPVKTAGIDITVNYYSVTAGILHIRRTGGGEIITPHSVSAGSGSFTITHSVRSGYPGQDNDTTAVEWDGVAVTAFVEGGPALPVSGGQEITQHTHGPSAGCFGTSGETSTEVNNVLTYEVNGAPPAQCSWTIDWDFNANCPGGTVTTHDIGVKVNGVNVSGSPFTVEPGYDNITGNTGATSDTGTVVTLQLDGVTLATHTVACPVDGMPPPEPNNWVVRANLTETCNGSPTPAPTSTPAPTVGPTPTPRATPSPFPTPGPEPSPMPPGSPPPGPTAPPGGSPGENGNVMVLNTSDFYAPVKKALEEAQSAIAPPPDNGGSGGAFGDGPPTQEDIERGDLDNLKPKLEQIIQRKTDVVNDIRGKIDGFGQVIDTLPTSFGSVSSVPIPFNLFGSVTASVGDAPTAMTLPSSINLSQWLPMIAIVRLVLLWILRCVFWIKVIQLFAAQGTHTKAVP